MVLALLYLPYMLMLRRESFFRFNRMILLGIMALSLLQPLCNIPGMSLDRQPVMHAAQIQMIELGIPVNMLPELQVTANAPSKISVSIFMLISFIYIIGMCVVLAMRLWQVGRLWYGLKRGSLWQQKEDGITVCCHAEAVMPFSWMDSIVISEQDYNEAGREIILHETGHIRCGHSWDVLLLTLTQMVQWWNPLVYVLGISLRDVHEYEADDYVLRQGISAQGYQLLLIKKAVGSGSYAFANNFNHSLTKKRITMMKQSKSNPWMRSKALYVIPVAALALSAFATPKFVKPIEGVVANPESKRTEVSANVQIWDEKNKEPLIFTNNKRVTKDDIKELDQKTIASIDVLKSESATEIYGEEGKNGAILIKTQSDDKASANLPLNVKSGSLRVVVDGEEMTPLEAVKAVQGKEIKNIVTPHPDGTIELAVETAEPDDDPIIEKPDVMPEFPGGMNEMFGWMMRNVKYPKEAQDYGVQGRILVQFAVEKDGSISSVKVLKGVGVNEDNGIVVTAHKAKDDSPEEVKKEKEDKGRIALQEEAIRVVKSMPNWVPGSVKGKPVRTKFTLPIMFRLS